MEHFSHLDKKGLEFMLTLNGFNQLHNHLLYNNYVKEYENNQNKLLLIIHSYMQSDKFNQKYKLYKSRTEAEKNKLIEHKNKYLITKMALDNIELELTTLLKSKK